jgi:hydrogenase nickel incorporation protein HypA/HybF
MHEASVTEAFVKIAVEEAERSKATSVESINLVVGEMTGYMAESLEFYFRTFAKNTIVEGAKLNVKYIKPKIRCPACGLLFERKQFTFDCPNCGVPGEMTKTGNEFFIETMNIIKDDQ